jgi:hypothetical protein
MTEGRSTPTVTGVSTSLDSLKRARNRRDFDITRHSKTQPVSRKIAIPNTPAK